MGRRKLLYRTVLGALAALGPISLFVLGPTAARSDVSGVIGSAYGYFASISQSGGPAETRGPEPVVTLPPSGSATPITAGAASGSVVIDGQTFYSSGPITLTAQGTTGPTGSASSSAGIIDVTTFGGAFSADEVHSTCTATESGATGTTTILGGVVRTSETMTEPIPIEPDVNYTRTGTVDGTDYRIVLNEQIEDPDTGALTVNAAHLYFLGPTIEGEVIIGQSVCGVAVTAPTTTTFGLTTTTAGDTTTTTGATTTTFGDTTTTLGDTTTTLPPTTTTLPPTTTTLPPTTTTLPPTTTTLRPCRPGYGHGDKNHCHTGPPGRE